jgi:cytochrome c biogenesis protein ResB
MARSVRRSLSRLIAFLSSGRLAVWLLAILAFVVGLYLWIPQPVPGEEALVDQWVARSGAFGELCRLVGLTDILHSWVFWAPYALLVVNLSFCMTRRLGAILASCRVPESLPPVLPSWQRRRVESGPDAEAVARCLRRRGYRTRILDGAVHGLRGRYARLGHWVFHTALLALLVGGMAVALAPEPFRGSVGIGEGEPFDLHSSQFLITDTRVRAGLPPLRFTVDEIDVLPDNGDVRRFEVRLRDPEGKPGSTGINRPYRSRPYQVMAHGFGFMPGWVIVNQKGRALRGAWVKLVPFPLERWDSFPLGVEDSTVEVRFYPDYERNGGKERTRSQELRNPKFRVRAVWRGTRVYDGLLEPGQRVSLGQEGKEFFFVPEIRKYGIVLVIQEQGYAVVLAGIGIMILGLVVRYARLRKEIVVGIQGGALEVAGHSEILENLFAEELDRLVGELAAAAPQAPNAPQADRGEAT